MRKCWPLYRREPHRGRIKNSYPSFHGTAVAGDRHGFLGASLRVHWPGRVMRCTSACVLRVHWPGRVMRRASACVLRFHWPGKRWRSESGWKFDEASSFRATKLIGPSRYGVISDSRSPPSEASAGEPWCVDGACVGSAWTDTCGGTCRLDPERWRGFPWVPMSC